MPRPGAANAVVPKNGIGIAFWIAGVPRSPDMVKVDVPSPIAAGISRFGIGAARNSACAIGANMMNRAALPMKVCVQWASSGCPAKPAARIAAAGASRSTLQPR